MPAVWNLVWKITQIPYTFGGTESVVSRAELIPQSLHFQAQVTPLAILG